MRMNQSQTIAQRVMTEKVVDGNTRVKRYIGVKNETLNEETYLIQERTRSNVGYLNGKLWIS